MCLVLLKIYESLPTSWNTHIKKILTSLWHLEESSAVASASCLGRTGNDQTEPTWSRERAKRKVQITANRHLKHNHHF